MASPSAAWRRSSRSIGSGDNCVEVRPLPGAIAVRDSKRPDAPPLLVTPAAWREFLARISPARPEAPPGRPAAAAARG